MRTLRVSGWHGYQPSVEVTTPTGRRHRCAPGQTLLDLAVEAGEQALRRAGLPAGELDAIVYAGAVGVQPIPCTAALVHERVAMGAKATAFDVNSTCTSFLTALDLVSSPIDDGRWRHALIVAADQASGGLDPSVGATSELFSDGAAAVVVSATDDPAQGVIAAASRTWSEGAHSTEIRGGLLGLPASRYGERPAADYLFDMRGEQVLRLTLAKLPELFAEFLETSGLSLDDIDLVIPHQASPALRLVMRRLGVTRYLDRFREHGNMVSASVPFVFARALDEGIVGPGDTVLLCGTAAGLTANFLALRL